MEIAQTADHALRALQSLAYGGPATATELATRLGLARTVAQRIIATLHQRDFVTQGRDGRFTIGSEVYRLAGHSRLEIAQLAAPLLDTLARDVGETVVLSAKDGLDAVVSLVAGSTAHAVRVDYPLGARHPVTFGAAGRAILMTQDAHTRAAAIRLASDPAVAMERLQEALGTGYAISHDELQLGVHGIAMPISAKNFDGSLSILTPSIRADRLEGFLPNLRATSRELAAALRAVRQSS